MNLEKQEPVQDDPKVTYWKEKLNALIRQQPHLYGAMAGVSIRCGNRGVKLYDYCGDVRLHPASNMKLFTSATALSVLGEKHTFKTQLLIDGEVYCNTLHGNLYIKGKGDPTLLPIDFQRFAVTIYKKGIHFITGDVIADDGWYDDIRLSQDMMWSDEHHYYGAQISALTVSPDTDYDAGTVIVEVTPATSVGKKPRINVTPETTYIRFDNHAVTGPSYAEENIQVIRKHGRNILIIEGTIPLTSKTIKEWIAVWEPTLYALDVFEHALKKQNISWTGKTRVGRTPLHAKQLAQHQSMPLADLLIPFMKLSNNSHGEVLIKEMGKVCQREGSWKKGLETLINQLSRWGINQHTLSIRDGSGISHVNLIPANEITLLLYAIQREAWFPSFLKSLPVSGMNCRMVGGTLSNRLHGLAVKAKTGTIHGVSTLSGYVKTENNRELIFSILLNNLLNEDDGPRIEDQIVEWITKL